MSAYALSPAVNDPVLRGFCRIAAEAGQILMHYWRGEHSVTIKADESPVTQADIEADRFIVSELKKLLSGVPVVSEEGVHDQIKDLFLLVDPLDGTKSYIRGGKNFTVNIGLIENRRPVAGVVLSPAHGVMHIGNLAQGAWRIEKDKPAERIRTRAVPEAGYSAIISHSHSTPETDAFLATLNVKERSSAASSLKFCKLAEAAADVYPRFGRTMEWDTAAGQAVLEAAGGRVTTPDGEPFLYGKPGFENGNFIAWGK